MVPKVQEKQKAEELRRKGYSYSDILKEVNVAKSSLSLWLKDLPLSKDEKHYLKKRREGNISIGRIRAATSNHLRRLIRDKFLLQEARKEFEAKVKEPFFLIGVALYWAEGAKRSSSFGFMNSDPEMIGLMLSWIRTFLEVQESEIGVRLYTHKAYAHEGYEDYWSNSLGLSRNYFKKTVLKNSVAIVKRRPEYKGCMRIELMRVRHIRRMKFWQVMLVEHFKKTR
jgi:hypothetical protein